MLSQRHLGHLSVAFLRNEWNLQPYAEATLESQHDPDGLSAYSLVLRKRRICWFEVGLKSLYMCPGAGP
jgi:hypothetical protein